MSTNSTMSAGLEALLFIYGDPFDAKKAAKILNASVAEVAQAAQELREIFSKESRGLTLIEHDGCYQLATKPEFSKLLETVLKAELNESLTPASLETLSIVTYAGPVSRSEIDYIRGVNSTYTVHSLLLRGLIDRAQDPQRGNAFIYRPSIQLLQHLGVSRVNELPEFERFHVLIASLRQQTTSEEASAKS